MAIIGAAPAFDPEDFVRPASADTIPNAYFIGPFGRRVSFASQQRRVLNTIWAVEQQGKIPAGARVAVVGAGLAGITAAVALAARKFSVSLYETLPRAFNKQARTNHRYIHPTINFWPEEGIGSGTNFPFFDWAAGKCEHVVGDVFDEWEYLINNNRHLARYISRYKCNRDILEIVPEPPRVRLAIANSSSEVFEAVFVTTGFGDEQIFPYTDTVSYWEQDYIEDRVRDSDKRDYLVSGTGDGGLIDTLRLLHKNFKLGELCIAVAEVLNIQGMSSELDEIEQASKDAFLANAGVPVGATEDQIKAATERGEAAAALEYHRLIEPFIENRLPDEVSKLIDGSLIHNRRRSIELVGLLPSPFSVGAAPIHKLLIAHALFFKIMTYEQGELSSDGGSLSLIVGGVRHPKTPQFSIARHGSNLPVAKFIPDKVDLARLRRKQETAVSWIREGVFPRDYFQFPDYPPHDGRNKHFIESRTTRAKRYFNEAHGASTRPDFKRRCFVVQGAKDAETLPTRLFGIEVTGIKGRPRFKTGVGRAI